MKTEENLNKALKRVTVLLSGRGSNFCALHDNAHGYEITRVISNNPEAIGLSEARNRGVATEIVCRADYPSKDAFHAALLEATTASKPDLIALAGFMALLRPAFVDTFWGKLVNIHPSLLPKYPGLDTHSRVIADQESEHGCSVGFVDAGTDTGPLIAQSALKILPSDTPATLQHRVHSLEHKLYPWVLKQLSLNRVWLEGHSVVYSSEAQVEAKEFDLSIFPESSGGKETLSQS